MIDSICSINHHTFNKIVGSKYEQGNAYVQFDSSEKNYFIKIPNALNTKQKINTEIVESQSLFQSFVFIIENCIPLDMTRYIQDFKNNLTDTILRDFSKRHRVLKKQIFEFVDNSAFEIPKNKEILAFFSHLIHSHMVICQGNSFNQVVAKNGNSNHSYFISAKQIKKFDSHSIAMEYAIKTNKCFEALDYKTMTISNIKEYANKYNIPYMLKSDKSSLIETIENFIKKNDINEYEQLNISVKIKSC